MINNNKILTVSYGTFSCTLEGFDDSFGTMKAIAEYFRDLASDDRYFGAEPPQPDAEMLARIAQKEISRRVEAREHEGKIVLSAHADEAQAAALAAPAAAAAVVADGVAHEDVAQEDVAQEPTEAPAAQPAADAMDNESVQPLAADAAQEDDADLEETPEEVLTSEDDQEAETPVVIAEDAAPVEDEIDIVPGQPDADVEAFFDKASSQDTPVEDIDAPAPSVAATPAADSIAAKLQRIRAVVAQHDDDDEDDDFSEDEHANGDVASPAAEQDVETPDVMADTLRDIEGALDADEAADLDLSGVDDDDIDEITDILNRLENADAAPVKAADDRIITDIDMSDNALKDTLADMSDDDMLDDALENLFDDEGADAQANAVETPVVEDESKSAVSKVVASEGLSLETTAEAAQPDAKPVPRARVIKVKRADLQAAIESGALEEYDDEDQDASVSLDDLAPSRTKESSLSAEDEDELARELAALEADIELEQAPEDTNDAVASDEADDVIAAALADVDAAPEDPVIKRAPRASLPEIDADQGEDMSRLLAEADSQMGEPESATRRDAFAHLRAAVAAKKADEAMGSNEDTVGGDDAYRNDLADVVRPRRPVSGETRTKRPGEGRPAPLKLVAEQRIDVAQTAQSATGPVRPRRVAAVKPAPSEADGASFVDYAAEMGATKLPELLEAAASYMSFVEGREQFSRPQLMTKVRQAGPDGFSREDTLRSFGKLLREGKIEKIKAGRFAASDDIGFRPDQRAVG